jgi:hypothetical protein
MPSNAAKMAPVRLPVVLVVFLLIGPVILGVVTTVLSSLITPWQQSAASHFETGFAMTAMWFMTVPFFPDGWKLTVVPTATAAFLFWAGFRLVAWLSPRLFDARAGAMVIAMLIGALASVIAWEIVALAYEGHLASLGSLHVIGMHVIPTGAILGLLLSFMGNPERPNSAVEGGGS